MATKTPVRSVPRRRKTKKPHRVFLTILFIILMIGLLCCLIGAGYVASLASDLPDITAEDLVNAQTSFVYDKDGTQIATLHGGENRISVPLNEIPEYLIDAVIASEDIRFYQHHGVDYRGLVRALVTDLKETASSGSVSFSQGASTITMQLVKNVVGETEKTIPRKIKQILLAMQFEKHYEKDEILYYYLNEIYLGPQVYGVEAAAEYYFNKEVKDLTLAESALLVAVLRAPAYYTPYDAPERVLDVRNAVLGTMIAYDADKYGVTAEAAKSEPIVVYEGEGDEGAAYDHPWFVDAVVSDAIDIMESLGLDSSYVYTGGLNIYTTLDPAVQNAMEAAYANDENFPESSTGDIVESAMSIVEPSTGAVRGLVGGRAYTARRGFNRAVDLERSPGSTIKPLVAYAPAIELGYGAGSVIDDSRVTYGSWSPNNDSHTFAGRITMRQAVMESRNICAVRVLAAIGSETGLEYGIRNGLPLDPEHDNNLALTLGGLTYGVSPLDMAAGFATLANGGVHIEPYCVTSITDSNGNVIYSNLPDYTQVFSEATAYIMTDILTSAVNGGTGTAARISGWQTAGKTGTNGLPSASEDPDYAGKSGTKDGWFCGYTTALAGSVWMGYDNKKDAEGNLQYLTNLYGGTYPARLFNTVMTEALANYEKSDFSRPQGVVSRTVDVKTGREPTELTPADYIKNDIFPAEGGLLGFGDANVEWKEVEICVDTGKLCTEFCPNRQKKILLDGLDEKSGDQEKLGVPTVCTTHTKPVSGMVSVQICTDSAHDGVPVLANIAHGSASGGCPAGTVITRWYLPNKVPTTHCDIAAHQVVGGSTDPTNPGGEDPGASASLDTPSGPQLSSSENDVTIEWGAVSGTNVSYILERQASNGDPVRYRVYDTIYVDTEVESGVIYIYRLYAYDDATGQISGWTGSQTITK